MYSVTHRFSRRFSRQREGLTRFSERRDHMFADKGPGIGFLKTTRARHAEEAIGLTEGLVTVLRLTQADIKPAEDALTVAKGFFDAHQYAKAVQAAKRAESIAIALDERFTGYQKSLQDLQTQIESMKRLGLDTDSLEKVAGVAEEKVVAGIWENGAFVPNYMEGNGLLDKAIKEGRAFQEKAQIASNQIFVAELAIESVADLRSEGVLTVSVELQAKMARDLLDRGLIEPAAAMAARLHAETKSLGDQYRKATTTLSDAEILYSRLQREGFHSYEADAALRDARRCLREGAYARSIQHLERALQAFARRTNARASLAKAIEETRTRVKLLAGGGLSFMPDIQEVLGRAEREFHQGNYAGSSEDLRIATVLLDGVTRAPGKK